MAPTHNWRRVPMGTYAHRYVCSCGWESPETTNGDMAANVAIVRHEIDVAKQKGEPHGGPQVGSA